MVMDFENRVIETIQLNEQCTATEISEFMDLDGNLEVIGAIEKLVRKKLIRECGTKNGERMWEMKSGQRKDGAVKAAIIDQLKLNTLCTSAEIIKNNPTLNEKTIRYYLHHMKLDGLISWTNGPTGKRKHYCLTELGKINPNSKAQKEAAAQIDPCDIFQDLLQKASTGDTTLIKKINEKDKKIEALERELERERKLRKDIEEKYAKVQRMALAASKLVNS